MSMFCFMYKSTVKCANILYARKHILVYKNMYNQLIYPICMCDYSEP